MSKYSAAAEDLTIVLKKSDTTLLECLDCNQTFSNPEDLKNHAATHTEVQTYQCKICYKYLATESSMKNHRRIHRERKNVCKICGKGFYVLGRLRSHMGSIHGEDLRYSCTQCPKKFPVLISLQKHIQNAHGTKEYQCTICNKYFMRKYTLAEHISLVHSKARSFHCAICDKMYATKRAIRYHISKTHSEKTYPCPHCDKELATPSSLSVHVKNIHLRTREQCTKCKKVHSTKKPEVCPHVTQKEIHRFHCQICDLKFRTRNELKSHNLDEHREKQHLCDECGQVFDTKDELESHETSHSLDKKFECEICRKKYRDVTSLKRHRLNHFEKQFQCPICDRKFLREYLVQLHMPTHTNEKNLPCNYCPRFFRSTASLKQHEFLKHRSQARFKCQVCGKTFKVLRIFKIHQKRHERQYECDICKKHFETKSKIAQHIKLHMNLNETSETFNLSCGECSLRFKSADKMKEHMNTHLNSRPFNCDVCGKTFSTKKLLQAHLKYHVKKQQQLCEQCGYTCQIKDVLENHILKYHSGFEGTKNVVNGFFPQDDQEDEVKEKFACEECGRQLESLQLLELHRKTHLFECARCKQNLRTENMLADHIRKEHRTKKVYTCDVCGKSFNRKVHMMKHCVIHRREQRKREKIEKEIREFKTKKVYTCDVCGKSFNRKVHMMKHCVIHRREQRKREKIEKEVQNVELEEFQKKVEKVELKIAIEKQKVEKLNRLKVVSERKLVKKKNRRRKTVAKPVKEHVYKHWQPCQKCDLMLASQAQFRDHQKKYHVEGFRPQKRDLLRMAKKKQSSTTEEAQSEPKPATEEDKIEIEVRPRFPPTSTSEKLLFQCRRCDQDFTDEETFISHMKSHDLKIKLLHRCQDCDRTFDCLQTLAEHKTKHENATIEPIFVCPLCDMVFKKETGWKIHLRKVHEHWKCRYCSQVLSTDIFQAHLLTHVTETESKMDIEEMNQTVLESNVESEESYLKRTKLRVLHHCPYCDFSFTMFKNFNSHLIKIHQFSKCRPCNLILPLDKFEQHMQSDTHKEDKTFKCVECVAEFSNFQKMYYHRRRRHMFKCPECVMMYLPTLESYKEHLKSHGINVKDARKMNRNSQEANFTCAECGKTFMTKKGLGFHLKDMLKPKPRWQKIIFRCDPVYAKCKFCFKTFRNLSLHLEGGVCPEKLKRDWEKHLNDLKNTMIAQSYREQEIRKMEMEERRLWKQRRKRKGEGYENRKGKFKVLKCKVCWKVFYHPDGYNYHLKYRCPGKSGKRKISGVELKECVVLVKPMDLLEILEHTGYMIPSLLERKRRPKKPKCYCCNRVVCSFLSEVPFENPRRMEMNGGMENGRRDEMNEEEVLQALDIKVEAEFLSDHTYFNRSLLMPETEAEVSKWTEDEIEYQKKLESAMESIKEQFETFNMMTENNYMFYDKTWPKAGMEFCPLEPARKPQLKKTWSYSCYQIEVQMMDIADTANKSPEKQFEWNIKCNSYSPPPFVDEIINVFEDFFDSWKILVDPFLSLQEKVQFRKEIFGIDIEATSPTNLSVLITLCNENLNVEKAFEHYFSCANLPNIKSITYKNIETDKNGKTAFKCTVIYGSKPTEKIVCGIKIKLEDCEFVDQLAALQVISQTIANYLQPNQKFTLLEFGCKNGFLGASLSNNYAKVVGFDTESEIVTGKRLCSYNDIANVTFLEATKTSIESAIKNVTDDQIHVIVNIDTKWITSLHLMKQLRSLVHLKSIVLVTTFSPKVYLPMSELINADPTFLGYSFIPVRSCVIQKTSEKSQFQLVMLLLREDVYGQKPIKTEPMDVRSMMETTVE